MTNIFLISLMLYLMSGLTTTQQHYIVNSGTVSTEQMIDNFPEVDIKISLKDTILSYGDKIVLNINLTNNSNKDQKILFDKPKFSTGGPWATSANVTDIKTRKSMLKYENKTILVSQVYTEEQLKDKYYYLKPGQTIRGQYELSDIVVFNSPDNLLPKGTYKLMLFYYSNPSNIVRITIQ